MEQGESRRASAVLWPPSTSHAVMFTHETGTWPSQRRTRIGAPAQLWSGFPSVEACYPHLLSPCAPNPGAPMSLTRTKAPLRWMTYLLHVHFRTVYSHNTSYCVVIQLVTEKSRIPPPWSASITRVPNYLHGRLFQINFDPVWKTLDFPFCA